MPVGNPLPCDPMRGELRRQRELTFDGDTDVANSRWWYAVTGDTFVQIVRVSRHVSDDNRLAGFVRYTYSHKHNAHTKVSERTNRNLPARNTLVQLLALQ